MTVPRRERTAPVATAVLVVGAVATVASLLLPWHRSGERVRSAFGLAPIADRLDLAGAADVVLRIWPVLPFVLAVGVVLLCTGRARWAGALCVAVACAAVTIAATAVRAASGGLVVGTLAATFAALVTLVCALVTAVRAR